MKSRIVAMLLALTLVLMLVPAAYAQDDLSCMGLSADDCAILQAAAANSENMSSFNMDFKFNLSLTGLATLSPGASDITVTADGSGPLAVDKSKMTAEDPFAGLMMAMDANGSFTGGTESGGGSTSFVIVDGNFYLQDPTSGQWIGVNLMDLMNSGFLQQAGVPVSPEMLMGGMMGGDSSATDPMAALSALGLGDVDPAALVATPGFITNARLADDSIGGQTVYPFTTTLDFAPLFASPEFTKIMDSIMASAAQSDPSMAQVGPMIAMLLQQSQLTVSTGQWIGADDQFVHRFTFDINALIDLSAMMGGAGAGAGANSVQMPPINFALHIEVNFNDINAPVSVVAPEGATIVPASSFMGGGQ